LQRHEAELQRLGAQSLYLPGSTARNEATETSYVDLFFDYERGQFGLFESMDAREYTARIFRREADVMTRDILHRMPRPRIEASAIQVF
jgi:predicted nucleotidyltransferase